MGSFRDFHATEVWMGVLGLILHLWDRKLFKQLGSVSEALLQFQWARISDRS